VRADGDTAFRHGAPAIQQAAQTLANPFQVLQFVADQLADVGTGRATRPLDGDDLLDLAQGEAKPTRRDG
jgi:hypothetical protein